MDGVEERAAKKSETVGQDPNAPQAGCILYFGTMQCTG